MPDRTSSTRGQGRQTKKPGSAGKGRPLRKPVTRRPAWIAPVATLAGLAVLVGVFVLIRWATTAPAPPPLNSDTTAAVIATITSLPASELDQVGNGSVSNIIQRANGQPPLTASGKPVVFYYGAEFCPYCAAERWPLIIALSRFGTFSGLKATMSSSTDVYPDTQTFTFTSATYTSSYVVFQEVEASDRNQNPLQTPSPDQQKLLTQFDPSGGIPFIDFGNRYLVVKVSYQPDVISGMSALSIADALKDPSSAQAQAILGTANQITAAICLTTNNQPASVCSGAAVTAAEHSLA